ncbi:diacylglycerol kinase [Eggerthellaceae bacterium zg-1084]|uniref:Diacylglycerol kinase n=2 Tax=Berryella wangjianweii TaxID=2734634 RepID=A0A6M8IYH5_9ACTN|nr:diacylglycerol kinase [Berryella wangjianweii]QKF07975.1 diacylglycerol kinase [Berryella wangjianweii]
MRIHLGAAALVVVAGLVLGVSAVEWAVLAVCVGSVIGAECLNTAVEFVVDLVCPQFDERAGRAKDCAAGAVLVVAVAAAVAGLAVFTPHALDLIAPR